MRRRLILSFPAAGNVSLEVHDKIAHPIAVDEKIQGVHRQVKQYIRKTKIDQLEPDLIKEACKIFSN